jgi:hypothetical protein
VSSALNRSKVSGDFAFAGSFGFGASGDFAFLGHFDFGFSLGCFAGLLKPVAGFLTSTMIGRFWQWVERWNVSVVQTLGLVKLHSCRALALLGGISAEFCRTENDFRR